MDNMCHRLRRNIIWKEIQHYIINTYRPEVTIVINIVISLLKYNLWTKGLLICTASLFSIKIPLIFKSTMRVFALWTIHRFTWDLRARLNFSRRGRLNCKTANYANGSQTTAVCNKLIHWQIWILIASRLVGWQRNLQRPHCSIHGYRFTHTYCYCRIGVGVQSHREWRTSTEAIA